MNIKHFCFGLSATYMLLVGSLSAWAETVVEKVARTGVLTAGTRRDAIPFAYVNDQDEWTGYSIDLLVLIKDQLARELNQEIELELVEVSLPDRIPKVQSGELDILCDITSYTWERDRFVDFTIPYFQTGTRILVRADSGIDGSEASLANRRIGVVPDTISDQVIAVIQPEAELVQLQRREEVLEGLESGDLDGFAFDGLLLEAVRRAKDDANQYAVVPPLDQPPYGRQNYACMVPENNSTFLDSANLAIGQLMMGVLIEDEGYTEILNRWFGEDGEFPVDLELFRKYFRIAIGLREQINLEQAPEGSQ
jgi:polar amino acid transport system substrate-binding protein